MNTERFEKDEGGMDLALYMAQVIIIILRKNGDIKSLPGFKNGAHARVTTLAQSVRAMKVD